MSASKISTVQNLCSAVRSVDTPTLAATTAGMASSLRNLLQIPTFLQPLRIGKPPPRECENVKTVRQYVNLDLARQVLQENKAKLSSRDVAMPPPKCGLLAIVAYTAGHLDRKIAQMELASANGIERPEFRQLASTKALIAGTISRIGKTDVAVVRRNVALTKEAIAHFEIGKQIAFDRLTSVTCRSKQVYTGGNVDFVIHTATGVVSIDPLSLFKNDGVHADSGEAEGILELENRYRVSGIIDGKENGKPSLDEHAYPSKTIVLQEI